jgi:ketosteroid isomerase-like protein
MNAIALQGSDLIEFQKLIDGYYAAWSFSKGEATEGEAFKFYATDPDCIFYDTQPPVEGFQGVQSLHAGVQQRATQGSVEHVQLVPYPGKLKAWRNGDIIWTVVPYHVIALRSDGKTLEFDSRQTHLWEQRQGQWKIIHEHTAPALPQGWTGTAGSGIPHYSSWKKPVDRELQGFFDRYFAAWSDPMTFDRSEPEIPASFYSNDPGVLIYDPGSQLVLLGWAALRDWRLSLYRPLDQFNMGLRGNVCAWKRQDLAWVTFLVEITLTTKTGIQRQFLGRQTNILEPEDSEWSIVHEHLSIPFLA